ncbi:MAG: hypothetical protein KDB68_08090 [Planctomycetes bacterium]|nr:hypothetical protein [Planctomycetota bacterium]
MNEQKPKRPFHAWRLWPIVGFAGLIVWEVVAAQQDARPIEWVWVGIAVAAIIFVIILRVFMRV